MSEDFHFRHDMDPFQALDAEVERGRKAGLAEPNAMTLATVTKDGFPRARTVLYKGHSEDGLRFFTNYHSDKAHELQRGRAALLFHWNKLETQVRVEGVVEKTSRAESEAYFKTRARISQLGAWSSEQSQEIPSFDWLEQRYAEFDKKFAGAEVPCPPDWGGYRLRPLNFEFWFGRPGRMHERYCYDRTSLPDAGSTSASTGWRRFLRSP